MEFHERVCDGAVSVTKPHESKFRVGQLRVDLVIRVLEANAQA